MISFLFCHLIAETVFQKPPKVMTRFYTEFNHPLHSMKMNQLLKNSNHRPWPLPEVGWKYYQEWNNALFLH